MCALCGFWESDPLDERKQVILTTVLSAPYFFFQSLCQALSMGRKGGWGARTGRAQQMVTTAETGPACVLSNQTFPSCNSREVT